MSRNVRALESMPLDIKFLYSRILSAMVCADGDYNQLEIAEFYRIITKIQLPPKKRIQLMNSIITKEADFLKICSETDLNEYLNEHLNNQEKNIFRFSLMKDLIIIMKSDYIDTNSEKKLLGEIQNYFHVSDEQLSFFYEEYESDRRFFDDTVDDLEFKNIAVNTASAAAALGVPLAVLNYSGTFKGLGTLGIISGLRAIGKGRKTGRGSIILGLTATILLSITTYKITKHILSLKKDAKTELIQLMKEDIEKLHGETKNAIYRDIEYFTDHVIGIKDRDSRGLDNVLKIVDILMKAAATLENTEAVLI